MRNGKEPNDLTVSELRDALGDKDVTILLGKPEEDYGVVIAKGPGLAFIINAANQHKTVVSDYAKGIIEKIVSEDPEMNKTLAELKAEIPGDGILLITRNRNKPENRFISLVATGAAVQAVYSLLDAAGLLDDEPNDQNHSAQA